MQNKYPAWVAGAVAVIAVIGLIVALARNTTKNAQAPSEDNSGQTAEQAEESVSAGDALQGTLKISDAPQKGNLMLVMSDHIVYLSTGRDFSALLDKTVKVKISGDLEAFQLVDINLGE